MRRVLTALIGALLLSGCAELGIPEIEISRAESQQVTVLQRSWSVTQISEAPLTYKAVRAPMPNYQLFGPPAVTKTTQAYRAIETATGCKVVRGTMYQNISAEFFAQVVCT